MVNTVEKPPSEVHLYMACCLYYMQMYTEAEERANEYTTVEAQCRLHHPLSRDAAHRAHQTLFSALLTGASAS